ncbi:MAG TPA: hypothetical protein VLG46_13215 [Anaerolineae bacterium]|nr:hypothetical protein [Anaerolineae bacterium]
MLTQLSTQPVPFQQARARMSGVAWRCDACHVWWGSQNSQQPTTQFLLRLPEDIAPMLPWDEYRGWQLQVERAGICPECRRPTGRVVYAQV